MKRLAAMCVLLAAGVPAGVPGGARAAVTRCDGVAPLNTRCAFSAVATTRHVDGMLTSTLFAGTADYAIEGPSGRISASCYAYPSVTTCFPSEQGSFAPGDAITVTVDVTGAGSWGFALLH